MPRLFPRSWIDPARLIDAWPRDRPLCALASYRPQEGRSRWSVLAEPAAVFRHDGRSRWIGDVPACFDAVRLTDDPLADLDRLIAASACDADPRVPFCGGWIGYLSYELGGVIEPTTRSGDVSRNDRGWPLIELAWCPDAVLYDHLSGSWTNVGTPASLNLKAGQPTMGFELGALTPRVRRHDHEAAVARTIEYIHAGDIFQANITQRFSAEFSGSTREMAAAAFAVGQPWYGALMEMPDGRGLVSLSPELFVDVDGRSRRITTRPIKGTRPSTTPPDELLRSEKDAAELHMIVDLMRNDLGRVCEFGSVRVTNPRHIETHPTVHHGVAEVSGTLRESCSVSDLLRATFPPGSITGAPKVRAMQIIAELEPVERGPYCGAVGYISRCGNVGLNVAIRTLLLRGRRPKDRWDLLDGVIDYAAGGGIVADSDPAAEYQESLDKARVIEGLWNRDSTD